MQTQWVWIRVSENLQSSLEIYRCFSRSRRRSALKAAPLLDPHLSSDPLQPHFHHHWCVIPINPRCRNPEHLPDDKVFLKVLPCWRDQNRTVSRTDRTDLQWSFNMWDFTQIGWNSMLQRGGIQIKWPNKFRKIFKHELKKKNTNPQPPLHS